MRVFWCPNSLKTAHVMISWWKGFQFCKTFHILQVLVMTLQWKIFRSSTRQFTVWTTPKPLTELRDRRRVFITLNVMSKRYSSFFTKIYFCNNIFISYLTIPFCWQYRQPLWFENVFEYKEKITSWNLYSHTKYQYLFLSYFESKNKLK